MFLVLNLAIAVVWNKAEENIFLQINQNQSNKAKCIGTGKCRFNAKVARASASSESTHLFKKRIILPCSTAKMKKAINVL